MKTIGKNLFFVENQRIKLENCFENLELNEEFQIFCSYFHFLFTAGIGYPYGGYGYGHSLSHGYYGSSILH